MTSASQTSLDIPLRTQQWEQDIELTEIPCPAPSAKYAYEIWAAAGSKTRFFCKGRLMTGPRIDLGYNICAWASILTPNLFYAILIAPTLLYTKLWVFPLFTLISFITTISLLVLTSLSDPGILPRAEMQSLSPGLDEEIHATIGYVPSDDRNAAPLTAEQIQQGFRFCRTCKIVRPPRSFHCSDCNNCVRRFDHHCPFVNNCIGQRNYVYFTGLLLSLICHGLSIIGGSILCLNLSASAASERLRFILAGIVVVPTMLLLLIIIVFCMCHVALILRGRTTREYLRTDAITSGGRTLCAERGRSFVRPRELIQV